MNISLTQKQSIDRQGSSSDEPMKVHLGSSPDIDGGDDLQRSSQQISNAWLWNAEASAFCPQSIPGGIWPDLYNQWEQPIQPTTIVRFRGLLQSIELNGHFGVVDRWDAENDRWAVLMADGQEHLAKTENLDVVMPDDPMSFLNPFVAQPSVFWPDYWPGRKSYGYPRLGNATNRRETKRYAHKQHVSASLARARSDSNASDSTSAGGTDAVRSFPGGDCELARAGSNASLAPEVRTSIMMRNVPNDMTRDLLVELFVAQGFDGCYDFLYLPIDFQRDAALGYAFINLSTQDEAERFQQHFTGFTAWPVTSSKVCETAWSELDGLQAHVNRYRNSPVQHASVPDKFKPILFDKSGARIDFPPPTKSIRAPRFKTRTAKVALDACQGVKQA